MKEKFIALTLTGLIIKSNPWKEAHKAWFERVAQELRDDSVLEWADRDDYFEGVDSVMKRLYPSLSESKRTVKAREEFFNTVISLIEEDADVVNREILMFFLKLKENYPLALITTNTEEAVERIINAAKLKGLFNEVYSSKPEEKDDKEKVFEKFVKKHGKPLLYIGGERKETYSYCEKKGIKCVYANLENGEALSGVDTVYSAGELKEFVERNL